MRKEGRRQSLQEQEQDLLLLLGIGFQISIFLLSICDYVGYGFLGKPFEENV